MPLNPTETRKEELIELNNLVSENSLEGLRSAKDYISRALNALQMRLNTLRNTEMNILQKIYRFEDMATIESKYRADHFMKVDPIQSYQTIDTGTPDPHEYITYAKNKLLKKSEGFQNLMRERNKVGYLIRDVESQIKKLNDDLADVNDALSQTRSPSEADLEKDRITKRVIGEVYMLWEIHNIYKIMSRDASGKEGYTQNPKIVNTLEKLSVKFRAFAERNPYVLNGKLPLDLSYPGSDANGVAINSLIGSLRVVSKNQKTIDAVRKYSNEMLKNINDPYVSKRLSSKKVAKDEPTSDNSLANKTLTVSKFFDYTAPQAFWWTTFKEISQADAVVKGFKRFVSRLNGNTQYCDNPPKSDEEQARDDAEAQKDANEEAGKKEFQKELESVSGTDTEIYDEKISEYEQELQRLYTNSKYVSESTPDQGIDYSVTVAGNTLESVSGYLNSYSVIILATINRYVNYLNVLLGNGLIDQQRYDRLTLQASTDYVNWALQA